MESKALERTQSIQRVHQRAIICISSPLFNDRGGRLRFVILPFPRSPVAGIHPPAAAEAASRILLDFPFYILLNLLFFLQCFNPECFFFLFLLPPLLLPLRLFVFFSFVIFLVFVLYFRFHTVKNGAPTVSQGRPLHSDWLPASTIHLIADASSSSIAPPSQPPSPLLRLSTSPPLHLSTSPPPRLSTTKATRLDGAEAATLAPHAARHHHYTENKRTSKS